jgi:beta-glucosidase/6-phospho-beta-glucosidase/beta-galactosidase
MKHLVAASILATHSIVQHRPDAIIIQSETAEFLHEAKSDQSQEIKLINKQRLISFDLLYAYRPDSDVYNYLMDNGMTREEYDWFMKGEPPGYQVMGNDYYGRNEKIIKPDNSIAIAEDVMGWYQITKTYYDRYKKPVMHTETNTFDAEQAPTWLWKQWINILRMRADGVPVLGFTWYSLIDQIDWDTGLAKKNNTVNACGLYDLNRKPRPVAAEYKMLLKEYGQITIFPHGELFEVTTRNARLKVEV